jgi:RNA polymerase sigma-70 factor (ECF subfamily)
MALSEWNRMPVTNKGIHPADDASLLNRARQGDNNAATQLLEPHRKMLIGYLRSHIHNSTDVEDLAQEVLVRAYRNLDRYRGDGAFSSWVLGIAYHLLLDHYEQMKAAGARTVSLTALEDYFNAQVSQADPSPRLNDGGHNNGVHNKMYVEKLLNVMSRECTDIESKVMRLLYGGRTYREISELLGIKLDALRQHVCRGRGKLLAYLVEHDPEMLGGKEAISAAWEQACRAEDNRLRPTAQEQEAWQHPHRRKKEFREAVIKLAHFLPFMALLAWLLALALGG